MNSVAQEASARLRLFMLNQKLWPDELRTLEEALDVIERYTR